MTGAEWLASADLAAMLEFLKGKASDRKLRLFACACCRAVWSSLTHERSRRAVETAERYADGLAGDDELRRAYSMAHEAVGRYQEVKFGRKLVSRGGPTLAEWRLAFAANTAHVHTPFLIGRLKPVRNDPELSSLAPSLLRDIFGPLPFRQPAADRSWLTPDVLAIARGAYESREFGSLPILADALQDAGCDSEDILNHCRDTAVTHVRGCWVVDLVLGRE